MACRIPGCDTKYWDKNNKLQMFAADGKETLIKWQEILKRKFHIRDFGPNDRICILHFAEDAIERTYKKYLKGGTCVESQMRKPKLCFRALPTIFPNRYCNEIPEKLDYAIKNENPEFLNEKYKSLAFKRKSVNESTCLEEETIKTEMIINDLYSKVVNDISNGIKPFQNLTKSWTQSIDSNDCVIWSIPCRNRPTFPHLK